jgi:TonB-linked SusC/RagA family outer membrane protein
MKKSKTAGAFGLPLPLLKFLLLMKVSFAIMLITCLQVSATGYSQGEISLNYKKVEVSKILTAIQKESSYRFFYNNGLLNQLGKVDIRVNKASLPEVLNILLGDKFKFTITDKKLVIISPAGSDNTTSVVFAEVKGRVVDETGKPLSGVTVKVQGANRTVTTNEQGEFTIDAPEDATLEISYVGYKAQTVSVKGQKSLEISLQPNAAGLNEVVVVGYGSQRKRDVTGTISTVKGDDLKNIPVSSPSAALQGRASGVDIIRADGAPGSEPAIRIRGTGTLNNSDPLVVIDGVPAGTMNDVNPNDIASIEILKDASSSAIYGTRAANGVILITTKRGSYSDQMKVSLNGYTGFNKVSKYLKLATAPELAALKIESIENDNSTTGLGFWQTPTNAVQRTDWQRALFGTGKVNNGDIAIRGGNAHSNYSFSGNYYDEKGLIINSYFKRYSARINSEHRLGSRIKVGENFLYSNRSGSSPDTRSTQSGLVWSALRFNPSIPVFNDTTGKWGASTNDEMGDINNPVFTATINDIHTTNNNLLTNAYIEIEILKGLKLRGNLGYDQEVQEKYEFYPATPDQARKQSLASLKRTHTEYTSLLNEIYLTYNGQFGSDHSLTLTGGYSGQTSKGYTYYGQRTGFSDTDPNQLILDNGSGSNQFSGGNALSPTVLLSYFVRGNYAYKGKYLLTATMRADGSGRFAPGHQWGYFPAFSLGWRVSDEDFFKKNVSFINNLKLTGGWGQLGNQNVADFQYLGTLSASNQYNFGDPAAVVNASYIVGLSNPNITWERAEMSNISLEFGLVKNHLTGTLTWFNKDTKDMLVPASLVETYGAAPSIYGNVRVPDQNQGTLNNHGIELDLNYQGTAGKLGYSFGITGAWLSNRVTHLYGSKDNYIGSIVYGRQALDISRTYEGQPIASYYGYKTAGLYQEQGDIDKDPYVANDPNKGSIKPGDVRFVDIDGNGIVNDKDRVRLGDPNPRVTFGFHGSLSYKGLDLSWNFTGQLGSKLFNADRLTGLDGTQSFNFYEEANNRWHGKGTSNTVPRLSRQLNLNLNNRPSDLWVESGDYVSLKNLTIGYTLPRWTISNWQIPESRFYVSSYNLLMITGYRGYTPELGYTDGNRQRGVDVAQYPPSRNFTIGATFNF